MGLQVLQGPIWSLLVPAFCLMNKCGDEQGLGTSTASDAKKYFSDMKAHRIAFKSLKDADRGLIDMAFNKKKADERKEWLRGYEVSSIIRSF